MDLPKFRKLDAFFNRITTAINEAGTEAEFGAAYALFDDPTFLELVDGAQRELNDHYRHRYAERLRA